MCDSEDVTLLYYTYYLFRDKEKLLYSSNTLSTITKYIQRKYSTIIIKKLLSKKQEFIK